MDVDDDSVNDIVELYSSLIDHIEHLKLFYLGNDLKHYPSIQQKLNDICHQLDFIITLETSHSSFLALCQQKQQLTMLTEITEKMSKGQFQKVDYKISERRSNSQEFCNKNHYHLSDPESKKYQKDDKYESIISSTAEVPKVKGLNAIIGLHDVKKVLKSLVILPKTQPQLFYNRRMCNSILLYGPPGTGKTRLTHALAAEANANFHCVSASDILSHYVGQTEKKIKTLFQHLQRSCEFTVLFIDEVDAFCRKRTENEQEHTRRIKTEFMCHMSDIEDCKNIVVICATNCPWDLDSAILRRLQKRIYIPLPDHFERLEFFRFLTNNINFEDNLNDWTVLMEKTNGYSGSDLFDVVQTAMTIPLNELEDTKIWKCCADGFYEPVLEEQDFCNVICSELRDLPSNSVQARKVRLTDLLIAVDTVKCTVPLSEVKKFERFNNGTL